MSQLDMFAKVQESMHRGARISICGNFRYMLWRTWDVQKEHLVFCMINPSTADAKVDDRTVEKCLHYARAWGYGSLTIVNLFAYRTKSPAELALVAKRGVDVIGPENDAQVRSALESASAVICGWGNMPAPHVKREAAFFSSSLLPYVAKLACLGLNLDGSPKHPLYLRNDLLPQSFDLSKYIG